MCGIAGFLARSGPWTEDRLRRVTLAMTDAIAHRGPDDSGAWTDAEAGIALGHRRLSILDLSAAGHQPMVSADGRLVVSFNGEIYNFADLRTELEALGHSFRGHSDTEVLVAGVRAWGVEATLRRSNGMLAMAVWDRQQRTLTLARDRLGKKPLYYGWFDGCFLFGSELKALFQHPAFSWEIDRDALGLLIQYAWLPSPYSIFRNVRKVPPASYLTINAATTPDEAAPVAYWSARLAAEQGRREPFKGSLEEATDGLEALLGDAVRGRMIADVSLGAMLSGGIDSTTIVALMRTMSSRPVKTFCIGFHEPKYNEATHAAAIARHLGTDHTELYVTPEDSLEVIPHLPGMYDEPFADASQIPTFIVSRLARSEVTVALSGDGGDELFAGYNSYPRCLRQWEKSRRMPKGMRRLAAWVRRSTSVKKAALMRATSPVEILAAKHAHWDRPGDLVLGAGPLATVLTDPGRWARVDDPLQAMQLADIEGYLTDDILVKVDRASMAVALEVRCPLLDWRVVEYALGLPSSMRMGTDGGKLVLRNLLARHVPRELTERPKRGFAIPVTLWMCGPLRAWVESLLDESRLRQEGFFNADRVQRIWHQHLAGSHNHEQLLWSILMFQAWNEHWRAATEGVPMLAAS